LLKHLGDWNVLIVGGSGFVGSHLVTALLSSMCNVTVLSRSKGFIGKSQLQHTRFNYIEMKDLAVPEALEQESFDVVINCVSLQPSLDSVWVDYEQVNVSFSERLWRWAEKNGIKQFISFSSTAVYANSDEYLDENAIASPSSLYGLSKYCADKCLEINACRKSSMQTTVFRCPSIYGVNHNGGLVHSYYSMALEGREIDIYNNGADLRNLLFVDDLSMSVKQAITKLSYLDRFELFLLGSSDSMATYDIAIALRNFLGSSASVVKVPKKTSSSVNVCLDLSRVERVLDVHVSDIATGLRKYVGEMKNEI
jgi:nucleoside-diphosphate-sugar epimerase